MQINATGGYNLLYEALPPMRKRQDGLIINISSISGKRAYALGGIAYCASKFAMTALGTAAGNEVAADGGHAPEAARVGQSIVVDDDDRTARAGNKGIQEHLLLCRRMAAKSEKKYSRAGRRLPNRRLLP